MPYKCKKVGGKWVVHKKSKKGNWSALSSSGDHKSLMECNRQVRALYANEPGVKNETVIDMSGFIDGYMLDSVQYQMSNADEIVRVNISSRGGDYMAALGIYNMLRESGKHVITCAQGICASAGAVILLAGDEIEAAENSIIMFHMPQVLPNSPLAVDELEKITAQMKVMEDSLVKTIQARTDWDEEECRNFLNEEAYLTPGDAQNMKLLDKILPFKRKKVDVDDSLPLEVVNTLGTFNKEVERMAMKDICTQFELQVTNEMNEEQVQKLIVNTISELREKVVALETQNKELEAKLPKPKATLSQSVTNILKKSRTLEVNSLSQEGKVTPVVANELLTIYAGDDWLKNHVNEAGDIDDEFDKMIEALRKNEKVINYGGQAGTQQMPKVVAGENPLLKNAESRQAK